MSNANKEIIRRLVDQVFTRGNIDAVDELLSEDFVDHSLQHAQLFGATAHREGFKQLVRGVRAGLSDLKAEVDQLLTEGDRAALLVRAQGTHTGTFMGVPATGKRISVIDYHFFRLEKGRVREHWNQVNALEIMQQLGVIPSAPQQQS